MKKLLSEPLVHFLLLGGLIFGYYYWTDPDGGQEVDYHIVLDDGDVNRLLTNYTQNWNRLPDSATFRQMVLEELKSEIFYREALALNLDHNDEIIRRRMRQKMEFLLEDFADAQQVNEDSLKAWHARYPERFQQPATRTFRQVYFSPDKRKNPMDDALAFLQEHPAPSTAFWETAQGDPSHLPIRFEAQDANQLRQAFGDQFVGVLFSSSHSYSGLPGWLKPVASGYGVHAIWMEALEPAKLLDFELARADVIEDYQTNQSKELDAQFFNDLRGKYEISWRLNQFEQWAMPLQ
ncbi:MAG: peptidylprolyl isomerase [Bacteroidota bacterium]